MVGTNLYHKHKNSSICCLIPYLPAEKLQITPKKYQFCHPVPRFPRYPCKQPDSEVLSVGWGGKERILSPLGMLTSSPRHLVLRVTSAAGREGPSLCLDLWASRGAGQGQGGQAATPLPEQLYNWLWEEWLQCPAGPGARWTAQLLLPEGLPGTGVGVGCHQEAAHAS